MLEPLQTTVPWHRRLVTYRTLALVILILGAIRVVVALVSPATASTLAPDEGTYAALTSVVASGEDWRVWNSNWGSGLYPGSRALIGPAAILASLGMVDITAVRVVSVLYAVGGQLLLLVLLRLVHTRYADRPTGVPLISWATLGLAIFVLMPSNVLWGNLALRESASQFWIIAAVVATAYLFITATDWRAKAAWSVAVAASIAMAFQARGYLAVAMVIALAAGVVWFGRQGPRFSLSLVSAIVVGTILGVTLSMPAAVPVTIPPSEQALTQAAALEQQAREAEAKAREFAQQAAAARQEAQAAAIAEQALATAGGDVQEALAVLAQSDAQAARAAEATLQSLAQQPDPQAALNALQEQAERRAQRLEARAQAEAQTAQAALDEAAVVAQPSVVEEGGGVLDSLRDGAVAAPEVVNPETYIDRGTAQREVSAIGAISAIPVDPCVRDSGLWEARWCELSRLPAASFAVMFRPLWPLDAGAESSAYAIWASVENVAWLALVALVVWVLVMRRPLQSRIVWIALVYGGLVVAGMAVLEGNLGTAFRHKSSVLWVLCVVLISVGLGRRADTPDTPISEPTRHQAHPEHRSEQVSRSIP